MPLKYRVLLSIMCTLGPWAAVVAAPKILAPVKANAAVELIEPSVASFLVEKDRILVFPFNRDVVVTVPFNAKAEKKEDRFGNFQSQKRIAMEKTGFEASDVLPVKMSRGYLLFDGWQNQLSQVSPDFKFVSPDRSIPYDLIRPAADRGGEPTHTQVQNFRRRYKAAYAAFKGQKFSGITPVPRAWVRDQYVNYSYQLPYTYLVLSRISDFPLAILACNEEFPSQCQLERACLVTGFPKDFRPRALTIHKESKQLVIGEEEGRFLRVLKFKSCLDVQYVGKIELPVQVKRMTDVFVDDKSRLWVSSFQMDDYLNSSIFMWEDIL